MPQIDARPHDTTDQQPLFLWEEERTHPMPWPPRAYDTSAVACRVAGPEWHILYKQNFYSVP